MTNQTTKQLYIKFWDNISIFESDKQLMRFASSVRTKYESLDKAKGTKYALRYFKEIERFTKMKFLGRTTQLECDLWTKTDYDGFPRWMGLCPKRRHEIEFQRGVLTILGFYRVGFIAPTRDCTTITDDPSRRFSMALIKNFSRFCRSFLKKRRITAFTMSGRHPIYASAKSGANGPLTMGETSIKDFQSLRKRHLVAPIRMLAKLVYQDPSELIEAMHFTNLEYKRSSSSDYAARIHFLSEGGGKTRVIAIPDVFTQSVLYPIHAHLMKVLKHFKQDGTYDHSVLANKLTRLTMSKDLFCFDLSAATDRFPVTLQLEVMKILFGKGITNLWKTIVLRDFLVRKEDGSRGCIRYRVGQPMGFLSSWPLFTLTHHLLVHYCSYRSKGKPDYLMIGDDLVICDTKTAKEYIKLCRHFDIDINMSKSIVPEKGKPRSGEIAKRFAKDGKEMSPIPPMVLAQSTSSCGGFLEFLEVVSSRTNSFKDRFSVLNYVQVLQYLINKNTESEKIRSLYACPIKLMVPFLKPLVDTQMLAYPAFVESSECEGNLYAWPAKPSTMYAVLYDGFLRETAAKRVLEFQKKLEQTDRDSAPLTTPILESYFYLKSEDLKTKVADVNFIADTASSRFADAIKALEDMLSEPDVTSPRNFLKKRDIRRTNTVESILQFKDQIDMPKPKNPRDFVSMITGGGIPPSNQETGKPAPVNPRDFLNSIMGKGDQK